MRRSAVMGMLLLWMFCALLGLAPSQAAQSAQPEPADKFALVVGIDAYDSGRNGGMNRLQGCVNDAKNMKASLEKNFDFAPDRVKILLDAEATHEAIVQAFRTHLIENARQHRNAQVLFYFSGHGATVADINGDEADGVDETLVPYDGTRDAQNTTNFDILDDEIDALYQELVKYTPNITFIFDSCHSGTATRGPSHPAQSAIKEASRDERRYPPLEDMPGLKGLPLAGSTPTAAPGNRNAGGKDVDSKDVDSRRVSLLPRGGKFVAIAGCLPQEFSEEYRSAPGGPQGAMTYNLLQAMEGATKTTTASQIWERTAQATTALYPSQHPQIEGNSKVLFLGGAIRDAAPPLEYRVEGDEIVISQGVPAGARAGGYVALSGTARGSETKAPVLARLKIERVQGQAAYAKKPAEDVPVAGTARLLTPYFTTAPIRVRLDLPEHPSVAARLREYFAGQSSFDLVHITGDADADLVVHYGPYSEIAVPQGKTPEARAIEQRNAAAQKGFYTTQGEKVLYDQFLESPAADQIANDAFYKLTDALEGYAHQRNLLGLHNTESKIEGALKTSILRVAGRLNAAGEFVEDPPGNETPVAAPDGVVDFEPYTGYKFRLANTTDRVLYACVVGISSDGAVVLLPDAAKPDSKFFTLKPQGAKTIVPAENGRPQKQIAEDSGTTLTAYTIPPGGVDVFKVLVSTQPTDFSYLEREAVAKRGPDERGLSTLLDALTAQAARTRAVRVIKGETKNFDDWVAIDWKVQTVEPSSRSITFGDH